MMQHRDKPGKAMPMMIIHSNNIQQWKPLRDSVRAENVLLSTLLSTGQMRESNRVIKQGIERIETSGKEKTWRVPPSAFNYKAGSSFMNWLPALLYRHLTFESKTLNCRGESKTESKTGMRAITRLLIITVFSHIACQIWTLLLKSPETTRLHWGHLDTACTSLEWPW
jgi:hypothetical protein